MSKRDKRNNVDNNIANDEEGAILAEVLAGVTILIIVCVFSLQVLAGLYKNRLDIEARDRAIEISNGIAEEILAFKCNRVVDGVNKNNVAYVSKKVNLCNFAYNKGTPKVEKNNLGDQTYKLVEEKILQRCT